MSDAPTYRCASSVAATQIDEASTVLLHLSKQTYFELNRTGTRLWNHVDEKGTATPDELVDALPDADVPRAERRADVEAFLDDLIQMDLLEEIG